VPKHAHLQGRDGEWVQAVPLQHYTDDCVFPISDSHSKGDSMETEERACDSTHVKAGEPPHSTPQVVPRPPDTQSVWYWLLPIILAWVLSPICAIGGFFVGQAIAPGGGGHAIESRHLRAIGVWLTMGGIGFVLPFLLLWPYFAVVSHKRSEPPRSPPK